MKIAIAILVVVAAGCARNAVVELELELPPAADPIHFASVSVRAGQPFEEAWLPEDDVVRLELQPSCERGAPPPACTDRTLDASCSAVVSVVSGAGSFETPLHVRIRFCRDPRCGALEDAMAPEHRVVIERAFYVGRYTQARTCIDVVPSISDPVPETIARCDVRCREGQTSSYCRLDGSHFCEPLR